MDLQRISRVVKLLELLYAGTAFSANKLARSFKCTRRTIFRDLALLRRAGVEIFFDWQKSTYVIPATNRRVWARLSPDECQSLVLAVATSPLRRVGAIASDIESAIAKLLTHSRERERVPLASLLDRVSIAQSTLENVSEPVLRKIVDALGQQQPVRIWFSASARDRPASTVISPKQVVMDGQSGWGVVAYSTWHRKVVRLNINDIRLVESLENVNEIPRLPAASNLVH